MRALPFLLLAGCYAELAVGVREPLGGDRLERETTLKLLVGTSLGSVEHPGAGRLDFAVMAESVPEEPGVAEEANLAAGAAFGVDDSLVSLSPFWFLRWSQRLEAQGVLVFDDSDVPGTGGHVLSYASGLGIAFDNEISTFATRGPLRQVRDAQVALIADVNLGHLAIGDDSAAFVGGELRLKLAPLGLLDGLLR